MQTESYQNQEVINDALINDALVENELLNEAEIESEEMANQLAAEQEIYQTVKQAEDIYKKGQSYKNPSKFKYGILYSLAGIVDIVDLLTLTGVGWFIAAAVSVILSTVIILIFWFTNTKQKNASEYQKKVKDFIESIPQNIAHLERRTVQAARLARHIKPLRKIAVKTYSVAKKNPIFKYAITAVANLIPILNILPWNVIGIWLSYRDEKESYRGARKTSEEALGNVMTSIA